MPQVEEATAVRWRKESPLLEQLLQNMPYPEQSYPLIFFLCKDIFTYAIRRISNGKDYEPLDSYSGCPMSTCQVSSDVVNCVKSLHAQTSVYTIDNTEVVNEVIQLRILSKHVKFIGLDCEWFNQKRKSQSTDTGHYPVALLQLATANECFLIRLSSMSGALPETVKDLLEDRHILKFGVAILEDAKRLQKMGISLRGAVDLRHIVKRCQKSRNIIQDPERLNKLGLDALASSILGIKLDKSLETRCSDWESDSLTKRQVAYAANDAIVSLQIFLALVLGKFDSKRKMDSLEYLKTNVFISQRSDTGSTTFTSQFMHYVFDQKKCQVSEVCSSPVNTQSVAFSDEFTKHAMSLCQGLIDLDFKQKNTGDKLKKVPSQKYKVCEEKTMKAKNGTVPIRTQPFYQNCYIIAPDGTVLCTCDKRKAEWYVTRNLGVIDKQDPYTVRLSFEPNVPRMFERDYYVTEKENRCVVCGRDDQYMRKMIIPRDYRRHFPDELKNHISHDILLLCPSCHHISSNHDEDLRQKLSDQYNIPLSQNVATEVSAKVKSAAKALLYSRDKLPPERRKELELVLETHENVKVAELDTSRLEQIIHSKTKHSYSPETHAAKLIKKVIDDGKLKEFVKMWREHFLETMNPQFLPPLWSTEHNLNVEKRAHKRYP